MNRIALLITVMLVTPMTVTCTQISAQEKDELTEEKKQAVIHALGKAMGEMYLYPDRAPEIEQSLQDLFDSGAYSETTGQGAFAMKLTEDLRSITNDLHFAVRPDAGDGSGLGGIRRMMGGDEEDGEAEAESSESGGGQQRAVRIGGGGATLDPDSPMFKMLHEQFRKNNFAMPKLEVLPGNVGYLRLDMMPPLDVARPTLDAAMAFLSNTDAMIIDVRDTPGGVGGFIPYLISYFYAEGGKHLYTRYFGAEDRSDRFFTADNVGGKHRHDLPLFVLTSSSTGSAAENLAFTLKNHGRATTVGETTRGGGHSATVVPLVDGFTALIPIADVIHPVTGAGFDGVGVTPSVAVPSSDALGKAHELAIESLIENATEKDRASLTETIDEMRAAREMGDGDTAAMEVYVGKFGSRSIFLEGGKLKYRREGGPALELKPLGDDSFRLSTPPSMRSAMALPNVRFERDDENQVKGFSLVRDGEVEEYVEKTVQ